MLCLSGFELFSFGARDCTVTSTLSIKESNQSEQHMQIQESQLGLALTCTRFLYVHGNVRSLVHCKM